MSTAHPVIVVTGANGGVGFGICHRLLFKFSEKAPSDALAACRTGALRPTIDVEGSIYDGLTLVMACRSRQRAEAARRKLFGLLDAHIAKLKASRDYDGHAELFRSNLHVEIEVLDLASVQSIFKFYEELRQNPRVPYVSHIVCNAGFAPFTSIDWKLAILQLCKEPIQAVTTPEFYLQSQGEMSVDGLGWVWQCNLFGHYALMRALHPLLAVTPAALGPARIIWTSSITAYPKFYDHSDWQLVHNDHAYEGSKFATDVLATELDRRAFAAAPNAEPAVRHFICEPGCASTNIQSALIGSVLDYVKFAIFYLARWCGSPHHTISTFTAAIAAVHLSLAALVLLPSPFAPSHTSEKVFQGERLRPVRYSAETGRWGDELVACTDVQGWDKSCAIASDLADKCDALYEELRTKYKS